MAGVERSVALGRRPVIDYAAIIAAAREIGLDRLSMPALARHLKVKHPSLYRHVTNRDDIVKGVIDAAFNEVQWPRRGSDWRRYVREYSELYARVLAGTNGLAAALGASVRMPDGPMRALNELRAALLDYGFEPRDALLFAHMLTQQLRQTYDFVRRAEDGRSLTFGDYRLELASRLDDAARGADPRLDSTLKEWLLTGNEEHFAQRLDILIEGFAPRLRSAR